MRAAQRRRERDAGAGDLRAGRMRQLERRRDRDRRRRWRPASSSAATTASASRARDDHRRLRIRAAADRDALACAEAGRACDRDRRRARGGVSTNRRGAGRAHGRDDDRLGVRARIDDDRLTGGEVRDARHFDICGARRRRGRHRRRDLRQEIRAVAVRISAVRKSARASIDSAAARPGPPPRHQRPAPARGIRSARLLKTP